MDTISNLQQEIADWADGVFPDRTAHDATVKLMLEEIPEFLQSPKDPLEYADIMILVLDIAHLNGIDIESAVKEKMRINRERQWIVNKKTRIARHTK